MNIDDFWKCPNCGAGTEEDHGGLGVEESVVYACKGPGRTCEGLVCECSSWADDDAVGVAEQHGTYLYPCSYAICYHCAWSGEMAGKDDGTPNRVWVLMRYDKGEKVRSTGVFETAKDANARAKGERKRGIKCKVVKFCRDM